MSGPKLTHGESTDSSTSSVTSNMRSDDLPSVVVVRGSDETDRPALADIVDSDLGRLGKLDYKSEGTVLGDITSSSASLSGGTENPAAPEAGAPAFELAAARDILGDVSQATEGDTLAPPKEPKFTPRGSVTLPSDRSRDTKESKKKDSKKDPKRDPKNNQEQEQTQNVKKKTGCIIM